MKTKQNRVFTDQPHFLAPLKSRISASYHSPLTRAGHALEKQGTRSLRNSIFPIPAGTNSNKNQLAQDIIEEILFDEATVVRRHADFIKGRYPDVVEMIDVISDFGDGAGLRYNRMKDGTIIFNTFLEP